MREYKVKFKADVPGILGFPTQKEGMEIYEASSARDAMEKCRKDFTYSTDGEDPDEWGFAILDVSLV